MSKWLKNLLSYCENGKIDKCPVCGCSEVDVQKHTDGNRNSLTFKCAGCKATDHFDGQFDL